MSRLNWRTVGEVVGLGAVVASLVFVGVQLQQDQVFARSELGANSFEGNHETADALTDPEFATIYAKMLEMPEELSLEEMVMLNGFFTQIADLMTRECYLVERGIFAECDNLVRDNIRRYFGNAYAQDWWRISDTRAPFELPDWVDDAIEQRGRNVESQRIKAIQESASSRK